MIEVNPTKEKEKIFQIGNELYEIEIWVYNFISSYPPHQISFAAIEELVIEEDIRQWWVEGYLVLRSDYEILERGYIDPQTNSVVKPNVLFRTDARNRINIKIKPYTESLTPKLSYVDNVSDADEGNRSLWEMNFDLVIYDIKDESQDNIEKKKIYYFKDERHQVLSERVLEWSTGMNIEPSGGKFPTDAQRTKKPCAIIKELIEAASKLNGSDSESLKIGFVDGGSIKKPNINLDNFKDGEWELGPATDTMFYVSPSNNSVLNDIEYILPFCRSTDGSPVILNFGRRANDKTWKLIPLSSYFKNAKNNQVEQLYIHDGMDNIGTPNIPRGEEGTENKANANNLKNFSSGYASVIYNYNYIPRSSLDDEEFVNSPVYNYNFKSGKYNISFSENKVENVLNKTKKIFGAGLFSKGENIVVNLNQTKTKGIKTRNVFLPNNFYNTDYSAVQLLKNIVFLNQNLYFSVQGLTFRTPGQFIYINKLSTHDNPFDDKFLGQWLTVKVTHNFSLKGYSNEIMATKIDSNKKLWQETDTAY